ncbi:LSU ribosomal protein L3P [Panacagrimonas perspica]|uniref:Large ribosomal subunit protein uL3 n=1 Tax=Panacagrimonas perspica TaxID=381431 RepID=A0A4S3K5X1_9GAMM|nr:50S ribosomal protein L3 [Panacagrimonas perspica]TDU28119.1 LSU ribosomal protein L3P [Panacagrimonas perspica]THD03530.1 50S ribosomal protein L3 [Panacagrimonas perspica]
MSIAIIGRKAGMTRVFTEAGESIPVTVIECTPNRVTQVKTTETDGYRAVQVTVGEVKASRVNKAQTGHFKKAGVAAGRGLWEIRVTDAEFADAAPGTEIKVEAFNDIKRVDVTGTSIGKGFAGVQKRWNFRGGRASHGNSLSHRVPGSIGQRQSPGKVWKGKKMAGHMGSEQITALNLDLVRVDSAKNLLLVKGAVPGHAGGDVVVRPTVK